MCISREMVFGIERDILIQTLVCCLLSVVMVGDGLDTDIFCLKSIKDSLVDPFNYLSSSWNFENNTEGFIPRGIQNCSALTGLDLSINQLTGPLPSDISTLLKYATSIDLSSNKFDGQIPPSLANCSFLNFLKLDNNMLSGQIPQEFEKLPRIKAITFSNNHLEGLVPVFNAHVSVNYANNSELCGGPLPACSFKNFHRSFKNGLIVGYVISVTSTIIASMSYFYRSLFPQLKQEKNKHSNKPKQMVNYICSITRRNTPRIVHQMRQFLSLQLLRKETEQMCVLLERLTSTLSFEELQDATDCFAIDNAVGVGKTGIMYHGRLPNGQFLAIKRLFHSQLFQRKFLSEIMILGKYRHRNILPLLGFCNEEKEKILVYQYMSNGRLSKWLHPLENEVRLKWPERFNIALGVARGLAWLHECDLHIVHLNICSECILLDENFEPIISNFGEAKFMNPNIEDGLGMMFEVNDGKKDVHDFGSVLFDLITGKTYHELSRSSSISNLCGNPSNFHNVIDKSLIGEGFENEVSALIKVASECVQPLPDQRPTMLQIYNNVSNIRKGLGSTDDSDTLRGSEIVSVISRDQIV